MECGRALSKGVHVNLARFPLLTKTYKLQIPRHLYDAMLAQAAAERPNECCGMLAGRSEGDVGRATYRFPLGNVADHPTVEYLSESRSLIGAVRTARDAGAEILAIYHSHPTSAPLPSRKDREMSVGWGDAVVHLIISLASDKPTVRAWRLTAESATETEWEVTGEAE